jgi:hypothetical protein
MKRSDEVRATETEAYENTAYVKNIKDRKVNDSRQF